MKKKYYYIHLIEINVAKEAESFKEYRGVTKAKNPIIAINFAKEDAELTKKGYYVKEIKII